MDEYEDMDRRKNERWMGMIDERLKSIEQMLKQEIGQQREEVARLRVKTDAFENRMRRLEMFLAIVAALLWLMSPKLSDIIGKALQ